MYDQQWLMGRENVKYMLTPLALVITFLVLPAPSSAQTMAAPLTGYKLHVDATPDGNAKLLHHHYFKKVNDNLVVGMLFDSDRPDAKLIGTEMVITKRLWQSLPASLKPIWHPHGPEVESGVLTIPDQTRENQKKTLKFISGTYGQMVFTTLPLRTTK
jgi:Protein of unknown function (DUF1264)